MTRLIVPLTQRGFDFELSDTAEIVAYLVDHPDELGIFQDRCMQVMGGLMQWRDFRTPAEIAAAMCDICAEVCKRIDINHIPRQRGTGMEPVIGGQERPGATRKP